MAHKQHKMDRTLQPAFKIPETITRTLPLVHQMSNGMKVYRILGGTQDVMRFSIIFEAGTRFQSIPFVVSSTVKLLNEGSRNYQAAEIAEKLDFYGASYEVNIDRDWATISVYCLTKHCERVLAIIKDFIVYPTFPERELEVYKQKNKQRIQLEREKVEVLAREQFLAALYGANHPYGIAAPAECYDRVTPDLLHDFHRQWLTSSNAFILLAGKFSEQEISCIEQHFGRDTWGNPPVRVPLPAPTPPEGRCFEVKKQDAIQSAIRIGRVLFHKEHPDYTGMVVLVNVLGGYFGSRLMQNIREDKGYTYGIYSMLVPQQHSVYLSIGTETSTEYTQAVLTEIYHEIKRLQSELVPEAELNLVKQYIYGEMLRTLDGPWAQAEVASEIVQSNLPNDYVEQLFEKIKRLQADQLLELANKYLQTEDLRQIVVK